MSKIIREKNKQCKRCVNFSTYILLGEENKKTWKVIQFWLTLKDPLCYPNGKVANLAINVCCLEVALISLDKVISVQPMLFPLWMDILILRYY